MGRSLLRFFLAPLYFGIVHCQTSTRVVTATTTLTASESGACNNFVGACVVYGTGAGVAPYTTTVYAGTPSPTTAIVTTTATTTVYVSSGATKTGADACNNFSGACVVYATNGQGTYTSTVYSGSSNGNGGNGGNGAGVIGSQGNGDGYIGAATSLSATTMWSILGVLSVYLTLMLSD